MSTTTLVLTDEQRTYLVNILYDAPDARINELERRDEVSYYDDDATGRDIDWEQYRVLTQVCKDLLDRLENPHRDLDQHYDRGLFWTRCNCGLEFAGRDKDEADWHQAEHKEKPEPAEGKWIRKWQ